jgi:hypothetical protein
MEVLDASLQPRGIDIPIGQPLASISSDFTNMARGSRYSSAEGVVGVFGIEEPVAGFNLDNKYLKLRFTFPNDGVYTGVYFPVTAEIETQFVPPLGGNWTAQQAVDHINTAIGSIGAQYAVNIRNHVAIRPMGDTLIEVITASVTSAASELGFVEGETTSRSVVFPDDPATFGVNATTDYCYFESGPNGGNLFSISSINSSSNTVYLDRNVAFLRPTDEDVITLGFVSTGNVRFFFEEPTYFEVNQSTQFVVEEDGVPKTYIPDPEVHTQIFPVEDKTVADNFAVGPVLAMRIPSLDGIAEMIQTTEDDEREGLTTKGDIVDVTYRRLWFNIDVSPAAGDIVYAGTPVLRISVGGSAVREYDLTLIGASPLPLQDLIDAINSDFDGLASNITVAPREYLVLDSEDEIRISASNDFTTAVGASTPGNTNRCASYGTYRITGVDLTTPTDIAVTQITGTLTTEDINIGIDTADPDPQVTIYRPGMQRLCTTNMADQTENGYYYADMEFVSMGVGDQFNIPPDLYGTVTGYRCYGYTLTNTNSALAFSTQEEVFAAVTSQVLEQDVDCSVPNETLIAGNNIGVTYSRSPATEDVHTFMTADSERVVNASVVGKHLLPAYVDSTIYYTGQIDADAVLDDLTALIEGLAPETRLEVSDITALITNRGANYIKTPVVLAIFYQDIERNMRVVFVEDREEIERLITFFADDITLERL